MRRIEGPFFVETEMDELITRSIMPQQSAGWIETRLSKSIMMRLQNYVETAKKNPVNHNWDLAGNISKSLLIEDKDNWFFQIILTPLIKQFMKCFPLYEKQVSILKEDAPYCLDKFWVNFQKENEFNPMHNHAGAFSYVIWVKIPTDWREQHALPISANSNSPKASDFEFQYTSILGEIEYYGYVLDKKSEGNMLFFPAKLQHCVYPFYNCAEERVSISGNICMTLNDNNNEEKINDK